ncbi:cholesterol 24-hydroxylase-like [Montipora capricornis]|uniref:cholesterol 24-hydroxylase-like n=1 Tax=Montipora capricornis TaxID=246305 RepID=UPI0035F14644
MATVTFAIFLIVFLASSFLGLLLTVCSVYLVYVHWKYSHIPTAKRDSFFSGHVPLIRRGKERGKILVEVVEELHSIYGPVVLIWLYHIPIIFICDPELVKKCLVTLNLPKNPYSYRSLASPFGQRLTGNGLVTQMNHDAWQKRRALLNPAFHRRHLMNFMSAFNKSCDLFLDKLDEYADGKTVIDMVPEFSRVTMDVIGKVAFGVDDDFIKDANSSFPSAITKGLEGVQAGFRSPFWRIDVSQFSFQKSVSQAIRLVRGYAQKVIQERQEAISRGDDTPDDILAHILSLAKTEPTLTIEDLVDEFVTFFVAGYETTSNQLSFTLYEILRHSEVEERILQEIETVLGSRQFVEYKDLGNLQYLGQTLKEGLRLHPSVDATARRTVKDENLGGYFIPSGTPVTFSWFILHRLPESWPEPKKFDPERFSPGTKSPSHGQFLPYFPFSLGPRTCIGQTLAQFEARVLMVRLLQEFELTLLPGQNEIKHEEKVTIRPEGGVLCTIKRRSRILQQRI